jgi:hypothetical protein
MAWMQAASCLLKMIVLIHVLLASILAQLYALADL